MRSTSIGSSSKRPAWPIRRRSSTRFWSIPLLWRVSRHRRGRHRGRCRGRHGGSRAAPRGRPAGRGGGCGDPVQDRSAAGAMPRQPWPPWRAAIRALNPTAPILAAQECRRRPCGGARARAACSERGVADDPQEPHPPSHVHAASLAATSLRAGVISMARLQDFLDVLRRRHGPNVLRLKGIVATSDDPTRPRGGACRAAHDPSEPTRCRHGPSDDRETRLVVITQAVDPGSICRTVGRVLRAARHRSARWRSPGARGRGAGRGCSSEHGLASASSSAMLAARAALFLIRAMLVARLRPAVSSSMRRQDEGRDRLAGDALRGGLGYRRVRMWSSISGGRDLVLFRHRIGRPARRRRARGCAWTGSGRRLRPACPAGAGPASPLLRLQNAGNSSTPKPTTGTPRVSRYSSVRGRSSSALAPAQTTPPACGRAPRGRPKCRGWSPRRDERRRSRRWRRPAMPASAAQIMVAATVVDPLRRSAIAKGRSARLSFIMSLATRQAAQILGPTGRS